MRFNQLSGILILCVLTCGISTDEHINRGLNAIMMDTIVPEGRKQASFRTPDAATNSEGSVKLETGVRRADMCTEGQTCIYKITSYMHGRSSALDGSDDKFEQSLMNDEYEVQVSTVANTNDNARVFELRGGTKLMKHGDDTGDHSKEFSECSIKIVQDRAHGKTLATVVPSSDKCPDWGSATLINTARTLVPVLAHSTAGKHTFMHKETSGSDDRRVDTNLIMVGAGQHRVESTIHHHFYSQQKSTDDHFNSLAQGMRTQEITHAHGNSFTKRIIRSRVETDPRSEDGDQFVNSVDEELSQSAVNPATVPASVYGGEEAMHQRKHALHTEVEITKLESRPTTTPPIQTHGNVDKFLQQATSEGEHVQQHNDALPWAHMKAMNSKENAYINMAPDQLLVHMKQMIKEIPTRKRGWARNEVSDMLENPQGQKTIMHLLTNKHVEHIAASAVLIGGLAHKIPASTTDLLALAHNDDLGMHINTQALVALRHPTCNSEHINMALQSLSQSQVAHRPGRELGLHTTAMHVQHALVAYAVKCSNTPETTLLEMDRHVSTTEESLLQAAAHTDWVSVSQYLVAIANSKLERHARVVEQLLEQESIPEFVMNRTKVTLSRLDGEAARQMHTTLLALESSTRASESKFGGDLKINYKWEFKAPADGKNGSPDPKFQTGIKFKAGAAVAKGLSASVAFPVKLWKKEWTIDALELKIETPDWEEDSNPNPVFTICMFNCKTEIYVWKGGKEDTEKKTKKEELLTSAKADSLAPELLESSTTAASCTDSDSEAYSDGESRCSLWKRQGACFKNYAIVNRGCRRTCNMCGDGRYDKLGNGETTSNVWLNNCGDGKCKDHTADTCYQQVTTSQQCTGDYFTFVKGGDKNCGCKTNAVAVGVRADAKYEYYKIRTDNYKYIQVGEPKGSKWLWDSSKEKSTAANPEIRTPALCHLNVMYDPACEKDYFHFVARGDKNCGCKTATGTIQVDPSNAAIDLYKITVPKKYTVKDEDKLGRCGTDKSKMKIHFKHDFDVTLFEKEVRFQAGPAPLVFTIESVGNFGFDAGIGALGGNGKPVCGWDAGKRVCSTKKVKCGNGEWANGQVMFVRPHVGVDLDGGVSLDIGIGRVTVGLHVNLLTITVPIALEANMGGTTGASSTSMELVMGAGAGRIYFSCDSWVTKRSEWTLFSWEGAKMFYPWQQNNFLGGFSDAVGISDPVYEMRDPLKDECQVVLFPVLGAKGGNPDYRYALQTEKQNLKERLPQKVQDSAQSVRSFGNCDTVELVDDDVGVTYGSANNFWLGGESGKNLPNDVRQDVDAISITTLPTEGDMADRWKRKDCCAFMSFTYPNYVGREAYHYNCNTPASSNKYPFNGYLKSAIIAPSCRGVRFHDDDDYANTWKYWLTSDPHPTTPYDMQSEVNGVKLWIGSDNSDAGVSQMLQSSEADASTKDSNTEKTGKPTDEGRGAEYKYPVVNQYAAFTLPSNGFDKLKNDKSGCWVCWPVEKEKKKSLLLQTGEDNALKEVETFAWKGDKGTVPKGCGDTYATLPDIGCFRTNKMKRLADKRAKQEKELKQDICKDCGSYFKKGSDQQKNCRLECTKKSDKSKKNEYNLCSNTCLYGKK